MFGVHYYGQSYFGQGYAQPQTFYLRLLRAFSRGVVGFNRTTRLENN